MPAKYNRVADPVSEQETSADWLPANESTDPNPPPGLWILLAGSLAISLLVMSVVAILF